MLENCHTMIYSNKKFSGSFIWLLMKKICQTFLLKGCNVLLLFRNMSSAHLLGYPFLYESQIIKKNTKKETWKKWWVVFGIQVLITSSQRIMSRICVVYTMAQSHHHILCIFGIFLFFAVWRSLPHLHISAGDKQNTQVFLLKRFPEK